MTVTDSPPPSDARSSSRSAVKQAFKRGLAALLPTLLTLVILIKGYQFLRDTVGYWISKMLILFWEGAFDYRVAREGWLAGVLTAFGIVLAAIIVFLMGYFLSTVVGRWMYGRVDHWLKRLPVIRQLYPSVKQVTDFLLSEEALKFTQVVAVPYPRHGIYSVGFVTGDGLRQLQEATDRRLMSVFVPTSPTPLTGFVIMLPEDEVVYLKMTVEEAFRLIVSGGVVTPLSQLPAGRPRGDADRSAHRGRTPQNTPRSGQGP